MPDPVKMPAPKPAPGQIIIHMGSKRYVMNVPTTPAEFCLCGECAECKARKVALDAFALRCGVAPLPEPKP